MQDDALIFAVAVVAPGLAIFLLGTALRVAARRTGPDSIIGIRISIAGLVLCFVVPGIAVLVAVVLGRLMWPAILGSIVALFYGYRMIRVGRRSWTRTLPVAGNASRDRFGCFRG